MIRSRKLPGIAAAVMLVAASVLTFDSCKAHKERKMARGHREFLRDEMEGGQAPGHRQQKKNQQRGTTKKSNSEK